MANRVKYSSKMPHFEIFTNNTGVDFCPFQSKRLRHFETFKRHIVRFRQWLSSNGLLLPGTNKSARKAQRRKYAEFRDSHGDNMRRWGVGMFVGG